MMVTCEDFFRKGYFAKGVDKDRASLVSWIYTKTYLGNMGDDVFIFMSFKVIILLKLTEKCKQAT